MIIAIDPGTRQMGVALFEDGKLVSSQTIVLNAAACMGGRYTEAYRKVKALLPGVSKLVCEAGFVGPNRATSMKLAGARAVLEMLAYQHKIPYIEYTPSQVKKAMTGKGNAKKEIVQAAVLEMFPDHNVGSLDESDAIAIGVCYAVETVSKRGGSVVGTSRKNTRK